MRLTCPRTDLLAALAAIAPAVPARTTNDALACVKAVAAADRLTLTAFDTELGIVATVAANVAAAGDRLFQFDRFAAALKAAEGADAVYDGKKWKFEESNEYEPPSRTTDEFPDVPDAASDAAVELDAAVLRDLLRRVSYAADRRDAGGRFALKGVLLDLSPAALTVVATDTKRLATASVQVSGHAHPPASAIVPLKAVGALERVLDGGTVRVTLRANDATFATADVTVYTALVQGRFAPWRNIVESAAGELLATLPADRFAARVRQAAVAADEESKRVDLCFAPGRVALRARGADTGAAAVSLAVACGRTVDTAFDPAYLLEFLKHAEGWVVVRQAAGDKPAVFEAADGVVALIMPLAG